MLEKLRGLLGLSAEATEEEIGTAVTAAVAAGTELAELDKALLEIDPKLGEIDQKARLAALKLLQASPTAENAGDKPDPKAGTTDPEKGTVAGMGADAAEVLVEAAVAAGKVPPKGEAREKLVKALASLSVADAKEVLGLVGTMVPKGGDLKGKADPADGGTAPGLRETMRKNLGLSCEALEKFAPDKVAAN